MKKVMEVNNMTCWNWTRIPFGAVILLALAVLVFTACGDEDVDINDLSETEFAAHMFGGDEDDWEFDEDTGTYTYDGKAITIEVPEGFVVSTKGKCYTEGDRVSRVKEAMVAEGEEEEDCPTGATVFDGDTGGNGNGSNGGTTVSGPCRLIKNGTWSEVESADNQRIEVGAAGGEHMDFYTRDGTGNTQAVSYIIPPVKAAMIWWGFGSQWEAPLGSECNNYDWEKDTTDYANGNADKDGRLDEGHSGLVIDLRKDPPVLVANVANMSSGAVRDLLTRQANAMENGLDVDVIVDQVSASSAGSSNTAPAPAAQAQPAAPAAPSCPDGVRGTDHDSVDGQYWTPIGDPNTWRVVNFWTNWAGQDQSSRNILLAPGDVGNLPGGGSYWSWPANCEQAARDAM